MAAYTTIDDPEAYFQVKAYTGNNTTDTAITLDGDNDLQPDFVWIKCRSSANSSALFNSVVGDDYHLVSNTTAAQAGDGSYFKSFDSDGFTLGTGGQVNDSGDTYVAWCWKESATSGFDIVSYTGNGTSDTDISHNLSAVPRMIIFKDRDTASNWQTGHASLGWTKTVYLNLTNASNTDTSYFNDTAPTSSVFTLGDNVMSNSDTKNYIAYCFAEKQGFSKFGSYTGNGNADGAFVYTGFRPAYIMIRDTGNAENWFLFDNKRDGYNVNKVLLYANTITADTTTGANQIDLLSNGFKCRSTDNGTNRSGATGFIYMAFAEAPFVNSNGVPCNAR